MDQIPASRPIPSDDRPDLRPEEAHYEQTYQTIDGDQGTYESVTQTSAQETEQRPPRRKVGFRCALALGVLLSASVLGLVAFAVYHFTATNGSASTTASVRVCDPEVWVASFNQGSGGRGILKSQLLGPVTCRAGCEADADCVSYESSNSACHFINDSFVELRDEPGTTSYRRQRVCVWGSATCVFTYEGRYDLSDQTDPPLTTELNLESCLLRCLNAASVCKGLSYNTKAGTGDCEPRNVATDLESRTKENDFVEYTMACTGVTTTSSVVTPISASTTTLPTTTLPTTTLPTTTLPTTTLPTTTLPTTTATTTPTTTTTPLHPGSWTCATESWTPFTAKGSAGLGAIKVSIRTDADCRSRCEADSYCVFYEFGSGICYFISESFVEPVDRTGHIFYRRQRTCQNGAANCVFTYEGRYNLDNVLDPALSSEPNLDSCLMRCLNTAFDCKGLSFNTQGGDCEPRNVANHLESRTLENDYVEYTMSCTGVTTTTTTTTTPTTATTHTG